MKKISYLLSLGFLLGITSCDSDGYFSSTEAALDSSGNGQGNQSGLITAAEWNDLENWEFWNDLIHGQAYSDKPDYWKFYTNKRISIVLKNNNAPVVDAKLELFENGNVVWEAKSDNAGKAELWIDLFQSSQSTDLNDYSLSVNGQIVNTALNFFQDGVNEIEIDDNLSTSDRVELAFIVDATGSMGDELEFLKDDLEDVIQSVENDHPTLNIYTSSVFYRDKGDDYVVRKSEFSGDLNTTLEFINNQSAGGGGDFPEAVHTALKTGIEELQWSENAKTRIAFLVLDAPPHYTSKIIEDLHNSIEEASRKGVKIIPVTASGIDKETEFLMRFFSISTNSTYVFITDDSGIGNEHLAPSVGEYEVE
ncbi:MAG: vWA domain-containing protein, partial [Bacteroidota bacterium]